MRGCVKSGYACRIAFETGENPKLFSRMKTVVLVFLRQCVDFPSEKLAMHLFGAKIQTLHNPRQPRLGHDSYFCPVW